MSGSVIAVLCRLVTTRPVLRTDLVVLVPQTLETSRALLAGEDVGLPFAPGYPHADSLDALGWVEHMDPAELADAGPFVGGWFITLARDGRVIGDCGTYGPPGDDGRVEIGYGLAAPSRGRGLGGAAVAALVEWVADQPGVRTVLAHVEVGNEPSRRLLARLGFTLVDEADGHWLLER